MTNFEFYKDELMAIADNGSDVALVKGEPVACDAIMCSQCELGEFNCGASLIHWLYVERVERPKINKRTKDFFDLIETGWVARDSNDRLYLYPVDDKPAKYNRGEWAGNRIIHNVPLFEDMFLFLTLDFIKHEDKEPWRVEDIRNLEVV